jgi:DNA (cytosine-5)-methyltransferase 1
MNKKHKDRIPIISFFSGGGFMDMGFMKAGFDIVFANEFCKCFASIHDEGIKSWCDVNAIKFKKITSTASITSLKPGFILKSAFSGNIPQLWGIIGGPPCQDFTMQGNGEGFNGERGKMTAVFYNRIRKMKPAFFVMENVIGLIARKEQKAILDDLIRKYISEDYYVDRTILNALDYGVPQYRRRVFMVGLRKNIFHPDIQNSYKNEDIQSMSFPWPIPLYKNACDKFNWPTQNPFGKYIERPIDIIRQIN